MHSLQTPASTLTADCGLDQAFASFVNAVLNFKGHHTALLWPVVTALLQVGASSICMGA